MGQGGELQGGGILHKSNVSLYNIDMNHRNNNLIDDSCIELISHLSERFFNLFYLHIRTRIWSIKLCA